MIIKPLALVLTPKQMAFAMDWSHHTVIFLLLLLQLLLLLFLQQTISTTNQHINLNHEGSRIEKEALLAFKNSITSDPLAVLSNWLNSTDICEFRRIHCNKWNLHVTKIHLNRSQIEGKLTPFLANLTGLRELDLSENRLSGRMFQEFSSLRHLTGLDLSKNLLEGPIPESFAHMSSLTYLNLGTNNLIGQIPASIFINCTFLTVVDLSDNGLSGKIPGEIGNELQYLFYLSLYSNYLSGEIPISLSNSSLLYRLDVDNNHLSGELPTRIVGNLKNLLSLHLSYNYLTSHDSNRNLTPFFASLSNCSNLNELEIAGNGLGGYLPPIIGNLTIQMSIINLEVNLIDGQIPSSLMNLANLTRLNLSNNMLTGRIPDELGLLPRLERLLLSNNLLSGEIPSSVGNIISLGLLNLSKNNLSGSIPSSIGNLSLLSDLFLQQNHLSGTIPSSLGNCKDMNKLDLSYNRLEGEIPRELAGIAKIFINLSNNALNGTLPLELSKMQQVLEIDLSSNNLTGHILHQLSSCVDLRLLNLSHNSLNGILPESFGELRSLESLDVSYNKLTGEIPLAINNCTSLSQLNLSYNDLDGVVPSEGIFSSFSNLSFLGNPHLCSDETCLERSKKRASFLHSREFLIILCSLASAIAFLSTVGCLIGFKKIKQILNSRKDSTIEDPEILLRSSYPRITHKELEEATDGFNQERLIGSGSYGRVYKGIMSDGTVVAVKVLQLQTGNSTRSFNRECQVLKHIRHRNLMRIITTCSLRDFKALVLPFMVNGSLENHLHMGFSDLTLSQRVSICSDVAEGMAYLHHHSPVRVIHCDLKPSNVLLNDDFTALVSDFGISRLVDNAYNLGDSTVNMLHGSIGYVAPEYGYGSRTSTKGDVYSFGVLLLEMVTRRRPTDERFEGGLSLQRWVRNHYNKNPERIVDTYLTNSARNQAPEIRKTWEIAILEILELGLVCTLEDQSIRPTMLDAADDLDRLKKYLAGDSSATFASSLGISSSNFGEE